MSEVQTEQSSRDPAGEIAELKARADALEQKLLAAGAEAEKRIVHAELKSEAVRAGMVDLDGLKLVDLSQMKLNEAGGVDGGAALMARLRRDKPWLFAGANSSSSAAAPPAQPTKPRLATEMSLDEWRAARAELLRRR